MNKKNLDVMNNWKQNEKLPRLKSRTEQILKFILVSNFLLS